jgi:predicted RNase H-like HicB family nuclease
MRIGIEIARSDHGGYRAWCPALPGCTVLGQSRKEATDRINEAIGGYLASLNVALPSEVRKISFRG